MRVDVSHDRALALIPLVSRGRSLGVLEVSAPREVLEEGWGVLDVIANQAAITLHNVSEQRRLRGQLETLQAVATLGRDLAKAREPEGAVKLAARFMAEQLGLPVAAWFASASSGWMVLISAMGLGPRKRRELRSEVGVVPRSALSRSPERDALVRRFAGALGAQDIATIEAGDALLLVAPAPDSPRSTLDAVGSLLADTLPHIASMVRVEQRNRQLDVGIAWIAHELRGPVLGVKAALESLAQTRRAPSFDAAVLRRSVQELERLAGTTEGILGWAVGARPLNRKSVDLIDLLEATVDSCRLETGKDSILLLASEPVIVRADPVHLRVAVTNLVRNALTFSEQGSKVEVIVELGDGWVTVGVKDDGPGIPPSERASIFDPFVRGTAFSRSHSGSGLGLFIARRIVEAHKGRIWIESEGQGAMFVMQLPAARRATRRCAS